MPAQAGIQGREGMDTGLRRYDGTESRYRCADHRCTCIFEGGTKDAKFGIVFIRNRRALRAFVVDGISFPQQTTTN
jgi:hypothetical protein